MILRKIELLTEFRGLPAGYSINFNGSPDTGTTEDNLLSPICLVGLNGSGKSNILEALGEIFFYLETFCKEKKRSKHVLAKYETPFGFQIAYTLPNRVVIQNIENWDELREKLSSNRIDPVITIRKKTNELPVFEVNVGEEKCLFTEPKVGEPGVLPKRVIGYSSGMNELLSNPFIKIDFQYLEDLKEKTNEALDPRLEVNRLFFMNYDANKYITIANYLFDVEDYDMSVYKKGTKAEDFGGINLKRIQEETGIKDVAYFTLRLQLEKVNDSSANYLPSALNVGLERLKACATFYQEQEEEVGKYNIRLTIQYDFCVNTATKEAFRDQFGTGYELFKTFYFLNLLNHDLVSKKTRNRVYNAKHGDIENLSEDIPKLEQERLRFRLFNIKLKGRNNQIIEYRKLSDGEHQLLQVVGSVLLANDPGVLFLLDEPETHFNPDWRSKFVKIINDSLNEKRDQQIILTTHSPYIVTDCQRENVFIFGRREDGYIKRAMNPSINTYGTAVSILADKIFGKTETVSEMSLKTLEALKGLPMGSIEEIQAVKERARVLGESPEKVLLFREILYKEKMLRDGDA